MGSDKRNILLISNDSKSVKDFRLSLLQEMRKKGWTVTVLCNPDGTFSDMEKALTPLGVQSIPLNFSNSGINPLKDLALLWKLKGFLGELRPSHLLLYRIKPIIYGSLATVFYPGIKIISTVTGLGYVYTDKSLKARLIRTLTNFLFKLAFARNHRIFFQNIGDQAEFNALRITSPEKTAVVPGSGIDLDEFPETPLPKALSFLMVARLLRDKGVWEYLYAAKNLKERNPQVSFKLLGGASDNPSAISVKEVTDYCAQHHLEYLGHQISALPYLQDSSVFVLPSYREGTPRSGLEALSVGRPIITTDNNGCRGLVDDDKNGIIVPIADATSLEKAMETLISLPPEKLQAMAQASRHLAQTTFDVTLVNQAMTRAIEE